MYNSWKGFKSFEQAWTFHGFCLTKRKPEGPNVLTGKLGRPRQHHGTEERKSKKIHVARVQRSFQLNPLPWPKERNQWAQAMYYEFCSILKNDVWDLVEDPKDRPIVGNRIALRNIYGMFVVEDQGSQRVFQCFGMDYCDTYPPAARFSSIRLVIGPGA